MTFRARNGVLTDSDPLIRALQGGELTILPLSRAREWEAKGMVEIVRDGEGRMVLASGVPLLDEEIDGGGG